MEGLLKDNKISDVISFTPKKTLTVKYNGKELVGNDTLTPTIVQNQPEVTYDAQDSEFYTLIKTDPDAPSREDPKFGEWRHWLVTNIPGNKLTEGQVLSEYIGAGPPPNTGLHRYIFILCKQPSKIHFKGEFICKANADTRNNWKAIDFIKKWNLEPEGINFYQAQYDDFVPTLYSKLGEVKEKPVEIQ
ncbi:hypothetical protein DICPUDRAFT_46512 [Dictyostelium purpureum]|uniref:Phosphatidylethanolamine-binding protein n=1 Tax=Dictyostelium purpureum TaxID=5786 RepID=F0ZF44_DICPU|nr:uncharacterized protein DICPUDRAFT_46512 [Dictyostelium purpureum]EGC37453.1 hypothetical protein DICPUDRAFT_46512 [Dictyostelium purpureum]|eukprot:XP_003286017.1 hypothetical protein DICPUDRAFT_46512 [Dictyostelium purpureum]